MQSAKSVATVFVIHWDFVIERMKVSLSSVCFHTRALGFEIAGLLMARSKIRPATLIDVMVERYRWVRERWTAGQHNELSSEKAQRLNSVVRPNVEANRTVAVCG